MAPEGAAAPRLGTTGLSPMETFQIRSLTRAEHMLALVMYSIIRLLVFRQSGYKNSAIATFDFMLIVFYDQNV